MDYQDSKKIYTKVLEKKLRIAHACEIGVFLPETSNIVDFIQDGVRATLIEPNPRIVEKIKAFFEGSTNVTLHPVAIHEYNGTLNLFEAEASTFAEGLPASPAMVNDRYEKKSAKKIMTECMLFSDIDVGDIDLLSIDTEGCEWYALKTMVSRPSIISIETHGKFYLNPFLSQIEDWLNREHYRIWYKTKSDSVYFRKGILELSKGEKIELLKMNLYLFLRRAKRFFHFRRGKKRLSST